MNAPQKGSAMDQILRGKLETLLGERRDKQNAAVRWRDFEALRQQLIKSGGAGGGGEPGPPGEPGVPPADWEDFKDRLTQAELDIDAAERDAQAIMEQAQNADAAASAATASIRRGFGTIRDQFLGSGWARWGTQGSVTTAANEVYAHGLTWTVAVTAAQSAGIEINTSDPVEWPGQTNAEGYAVEVEYTVPSAPDGLGSAAVMLRWTNSLGAFFDHRKLLSDMVAGQSIAGRTHIARGVFRRPAGYSGAFTGNAAFVFANYSAAGTTLTAKTLKIHRVTIRPATQEELGAGEVMVNVQAYLTSNYYTAVQADAAIAEQVGVVSAALGDTNASVTRHETAFASLSGSVARFTNIASVDGGLAAAGIEAVAFNTAGQGTGSVLRLIGDNVMVPGSLSAGVLTVGLGANMLQNSRFWDGKTHWQFGAAAQTAFNIREPGSTFAHPAFRTLELYQNGTDPNASALIRYSPEVEGTTPGTRNRLTGIPATPGKWYCASAYLSTHRCQGRVVLQFYDYDGTLLLSAPAAWEGPLPGASGNPDLWPRRHVIAQAPAGTAYVTCYFQKTGTLAGETNSYLFVWKPQIEETHAKAGGPTLYTSGETAMMTGDMFFSRFLRGRHLAVDEAIITTHLQLAAGTVGELQVQDASIGSAKLAGTIQSDNYAGGTNGTGWRITRAGSAEFNDVTIRRQMEVASGTVAVPNFAPQSRLLNYTKGGSETPDTWNYPTGGAVGLADGPGNIVTVMTTPIPISAWQGAKRTYIATAGMTGAVSAPVPPDAYWGWTADVLPLTRWEGNQSLRLRLCFWSHGVSGVTNCTVTWKIYEVS